MNDNLPIIATSTICGPCKILKNRLTELKIPFNLKDMFIDREFFAEHGIRSVPTLIIPETEEKFIGFDQIMTYFTQNEK
jgi:glutaredoxin